jgi:hypothetical protein
MDLHRHSAVGDQQSANGEEYSMEEMIEFIEAVKRADRHRKIERIERRLELSLRKAFKEQGRIFVRGLSKFKNRFSEAAQTGDWRLAIPSHFGDDKMVIVDEAMVPTEWMFVFYETAKKTLGMFEKPIDAAAQVALQHGALSQIADVGMKLSFDLKNPKAIAYLDQYAAKQVTNINETTREYLNTIMTQAANEGWSYDKTAEAITERFEEFAIGKPQEHIDSRAHLIAVTEVGNANLEGQMIVAQDLQDAGIVMEKAWDTVGDDKVSEGCQANAAVDWIPLNKEFPSGHMRPLRFPGCRCDLKTRIKH